MECGDYGVGTRGSQKLIRLHIECSEDSRKQAGLYIVTNQVRFARTLESELNTHIHKEGVNLLVPAFDNLIAVLPHCTCCRIPCLLTLLRSEVVFARFPVFLQSDTV